MSWQIVTLVLGLVWAVVTVMALSAWTRVAELKARRRVTLFGSDLPEYTTTGDGDD